MVWLAGAVDRSVCGDVDERAFARLAVAVGNYWVCKRQPAVVTEALKCFGRNGYVEDSGMPRHREAPLHSISGARAMCRRSTSCGVLACEPTVEAFLAEADLAAGADARLDSSQVRLREELCSAEEGTARRLVEQMALVLQASLLVRHAPLAVTDAFCASRLGGDWGMRSARCRWGVDTAALLARASPGQ